MGSEMCIRDRVGAHRDTGRLLELLDVIGVGALRIERDHERDAGTCLLYTSDAADERSSVDLGGRRIIKKKKTDEMSVVTC